MIIDKYLSYVLTSMWSCLFIIFKREQKDYCVVKKFTFVYICADLQWCVS